MNIRLPFVILNRVTYNKRLAQLKDTIDDLTNKYIVTQEENRNLHYNYEQLKAQHKDLTHQFNKVKHSYYNLKKKSDKS